jgi:phosphoribosylformylglycinamidine synthase
MLIGDRRPSLGGSEYLAFIHGLTAGAPPALDLSVEQAVQFTVRSLIRDGLVKTAHDCSEGGLAVALAEMAILSGVGVIVAEDFRPENGDKLDAWWFGESASRIIIACDEGVADDLLRRCRDVEPAISARIIGRTGGEEIRLGNDAQVGIEDAVNSYELALTQES